MNCFMQPKKTCIATNMRIQWGSKNRTFENRKHSKTGRFGVRFSHGLRSGPKWSGFRMVFKNRTICRPDLMSTIRKQDTSGFQILTIVFSLCIKMNLIQTQIEASQLILQTLFNKKARINRTYNDA